MNAVAKNSSCVPAFAPFAVSADLNAVAEVVATGVPLIRRDLTADRIAEARRIVAAADQMLAPAAFAIVAAWLKPLIAVTRNAPRWEDASDYTAALCDLCDTLPAGVFTAENRKAWLRQGEKASWWPSAAEIYEHLAKFGECIKRQVAGARRIVAAAENMKAEPTRHKPTPEERAAVAAKLDALRAEQAQQKALEEAVAEFGSWTPDGAESLSGDALADFLEGVIPSLDGLKRTVTEMRVEELRISAAMMRQVLAMSERAGV